MFHVDRGCPSVVSSLEMSKRSLAQSQASDAVRGEPVGDDSEVAQWTLPPDILGMIAARIAPNNELSRRALFATCRYFYEYTKFHGHTVRRWQTLVERVELPTTAASMTNTAAHVALRALHFSRYRDPALQCNGAHLLSLTQSLLAFKPLLRHLTVAAGMAAYVTRYLARDFPLLQSLRILEASPSHSLGLLMLGDHAHLESLELGSHLLAQPVQLPALRHIGLKGMHSGNAREALCMSPALESIVYEDVFQLPVAFDKAPSLRAISLRSCYIPAARVDTLLRHSATLTSLHLAYVKGALQWTHLRKLSALRVLRVEFCEGLENQLYREAATDDTLLVFPVLEDLTIRIATISYHSRFQVAPGFYAALTTLTALTLHNVGSTDVGHLRTLTNLTSLSLMYPNSTDAWEHRVTWHNAAHLEQHLPSLPRLRTLALFRHKLVTPRSVAACTALERLTLGQCGGTHLEQIRWPNYHGPTSLTIEA